MKNKSIVSALLGILLLAGTNGAAFARFPWFHHKHNHKSVSVKPKVTLEQAQSIALKRVPGTISDSKSETVNGKEVFRFEITANGGRKSVVWVNADSGKATKVEKEKTAKPKKAKK